MKMPVNSVDKQEETSSPRRHGGTEKINESKDYNHKITLGVAGIESDTRHRVAASFWAEQSE